MDDAKVYLIGSILFPLRFDNLTGLSKLMRTGWKVEHQHSQKLSPESFAYLTLRR